MGAGRPPFCRFVMPRDFVYFDLETQRTANDVGGWNHKDKMGMSVGVTFSTMSGAYAIYAEDMVEDLIDQLVRADLVIGDTHVGFDDPVLQGYSTWDIASQAISLDLMVDIEEKLGHRLKLDAIASATLGTGKTADGIDAIRWWQEGEIMKIAEYCCYDVKVTKAVHEYGVENGRVRYEDRFGQLREVEVSWEAP